MPPTVGRRGEELGERRMSFTTAPFGSSQFMRKHTQHASFGGEVRYNKAKAVVDDEGRVIPETQQASCPVHAYASQDAILSSARDAVVFGTAVRDVLAAARTDASPVHSYGEIQSTFTRRNSVCFGDAERELHKEKAPPCPVHAYATMRTSLRKVGAVAFGSTARYDLVFPMGPSRTGLMPATITPRGRRDGPERAAGTMTPRTPRTLEPIPQNPQKTEEEPSASQDTDVCGKRSR